MTATVQDYVSRNAQANSECTAVVFGGERLSYGELEESSNRLARLIMDMGSRKGDRVALLVSKSPRAIVAILAVLKAQCIYVPIDLTGPSIRVGNILRAIGPSLILASSSASAERLLCDLASSGGMNHSTPIGSIDDVALVGKGFRSRFTRSDWASYPSSPLSVSISPHQPAYIMFTSGSTGVPKGVLITHDSVIRFLDWAVPYFGIESSDRLSGHAPLHFDLSVFDTFGAFSTGAELHLVPTEANLQPHKLVDLIRASELTQWFSVPSALTFIAKHGVIDFNDFPSLRRVLWCGEVLPTPVLLYWMQRLPHVQFTNLYGPTETTVASSYYTVPAPPRTPVDQIPIGLPCGGEDLLVLDEQLDRAPQGQIGELYIAGGGLSPGYWQDEQATRAAFLSYPYSADRNARIYRTGDLARVGEDGLLYFLGRTDSQIKSRGYRIELGEIEAALNSLDVVDECAAVGVKTTGFEGTAICCAYCPRPGSRVEPRDLRGELGRLLPPYMLPTRWLVLASLPKNASGKIDRPRLRTLFEGDPE